MNIISVGCIISFITAIVTTNYLRKYREQQRKIRLEKTNPRFRSLNSLADIVDVMIKGLRNKWVNVNMDSFGYADGRGVCFGCAATNTLCELMGKSFSPDNIFNVERRMTIFNFGITLAEIEAFEQAINLLRLGNLVLFVRALKRVNLPFKLPTPKKIKKYGSLPILESYTYLNYLHDYERFSQWLKKKGY